MVKRLVAKKVRIVDILEGKFFQASEDRPSYVFTKLAERVSRVNIVGSVVEKFESELGKYSFLTLDDGTGEITAKSFGNDLFQGIEVGDIVKIIGKIRIFNEQIYINAEIAKKISANYELLRKLEILKLIIEKRKIVDEIKKISMQLSKEDLENYVKEKYGILKEELEILLKEKIDYSKQILSIIESLDKGEGVEIQKILEICNLPQRIIEESVNELLNQGYIFEEKPGIFKKVS